MPNYTVNVEKIYNENSNLKKDEVQKIIAWIESQPHLPQLTELQVILFFHSSYYDLDAAQKTVENYFTKRTDLDLLKSGDEDLIRRTLSILFIDFLPKRTPDDNAILFIKVLDPNPSKYVCVEQTKVVLMAMISHFHLFGPANGLITIYDMSRVSLRHLMKMNFSAIKQFICFLQEAAPLRIQNIHLINMNSVASALVSAVKPFMKKELFDKFKFHANCGSLYETVPKECLPKDYGGDSGTIQELHEKNLSSFLDNMDFFEWHDKQIIDKSKRHVKKEKTIKT